MKEHYLIDLPDKRKQHYVQCNWVANICVSSWPNVHVHSIFYHKISIQKTTRAENLLRFDPLNDILFMAYCILWLHYFCRALIRLGTLYHHGRKYLIIGMLEFPPVDVFPVYFSKPFSLRNLNVQICFEDFLEINPFSYYIVMVLMEVEYTRCSLASVLNVFIAQM